jgi:hypothetical protein
VKQYAIKDSVAKFFPPADPGEVSYGYLLRDISRVFFEFLRNLVVLGALKVVADVTENWVIRTIYVVALVMLMNWFYSFICQIDLKIIGHLTERRFAKWLDGFLSLTFALAATLACLWLINYTAAEIAAVKAH